MANLGPYHDFKDTAVACRSCGWQGRGADAARGEMFSDLMEFDCPKCRETLGFVMFPTLKEVASDPRSNPVDRDRARLRIDVQAVFEYEKLKSPDQLPGIDPPPTTLTWDEVEAGNRPFNTYVVIRHGEREIWREQGFYENYRRFGEVAAILKRKYGAALSDLVPTQRSEQDLYGDSMSSIDTVRRVRAGLGAD